MRRALIVMVGNFGGRVQGLGQEATRKDYGVLVAMPQGNSRAPSPANGQQ